MGVIPSPKMAFFPNFMNFGTDFPFFMIYFPKCEGKGSFPKSQINSLDVIVRPDLGLNCLGETPSLISIQNCFWLTLADRVSSFLRHSIYFNPVFT